MLRVNSLDLIKRNRKNLRKSELFLVLCTILFLSCKKNVFISGGDAVLRTSEDSVHFDTVFTKAGSVTQFIKVYNVNDKKLRLTEVRLAGGTASPFKINVDGIPGPTAANIEIDANDSTYLFVTVTIDPSDKRLPFIIRDSVAIQYNGNTRWIQLEAWGQNAHFYPSRIISSNETWNDTLPYVITGGLLVSENTTLTIEAGSRIFVHADAPILIEGTLQVNGQSYDSTRVLFTSDRLDYPYRDFPASWPGIIFRQKSKDNLVTYAVIKNAYQGIAVEQPSLNSNPRVILNACIIDNCYDAGLIALESSIVATNCLFSNNGKNLLLVKGGNYTFIHCTAAAYSNAYVLHKDPVLLLTDFIKTGNAITTANLKANFTNCIFWGDNGTVENEIVVIKEGTGVFDVTFNSCLWKAKDILQGVTKIAPLINEDPQFDSVNISRRVFNFRLKTGSPAIDKGIPTSIGVDLDGKIRNGKPDLGSYEKN